MTTDFPARHAELQGLMVKFAHEIPGPVSGFANLHKAATAAGAINAKTKELMALAIAVATHCEPSSPITFMIRSRPAPAVPR